MSYRPNWTFITYSIVGVVGLCLIFLGLAYGPSTGKGIFSLSVGGAILGAAFSEVMTNLKMLDSIENIKHILAEGLDRGTSYERDRLEEWKRVLHHYYITKINGDNVWRHSILDFSHSNYVGRLITDVIYKDKSGNEQTYRAEAYLKDDRLILTFKSHRFNEATDICVYPFMTKERFSYRTGLEFRETYDGPHMIGPALLSPQPVKGGEAIGAVDDEASRTLMKMWHEDFCFANSILVVDERHDLTELSVKQLPTGRAKMPTDIIPKTPVVDRLLSPPPSGGQMTQETNETETALEKVD